MPGANSRDVTARLTELEATVRGLTQELVSAEARIRELEAALEQSPSDPPAGRASTAESEADTEANPEDGADEKGPDPDDIIVA